MTILVSVGDAPEQAWKIQSWLFERFAAVVVEYCDGCDQVANALEIARVVSGIALDDLVGERPGLVVERPGLVGERPGFARRIGRAMWLAATAIGDGLRPDVSGRDANLERSFAELSEMLGRWLDGGTA